MQNTFQITLLNPVSTTKSNLLFCTKSAIDFTLTNVSQSKLEVIYIILLILSVSSPISLESKTS